MGRGPQDQNGMGVRERRDLIIHDPSAKGRQEFSQVLKAGAGGGRQGCVLVGGIQVKVLLGRAELPQCPLHPHPQGRVAMVGRTGTIIASPKHRSPVPGGELESVLLIPHQGLWNFWACSGLSGGLIQGSKLAPNS